VTKSRLTLFEARATTIPTGIEIAPIKTNIEITWHREKHND